MFDPKSRYLEAPSYTVIDRRGRSVSVTGRAPVVAQALAGLHVRKDGQRLDLLAGRYIDDATGFWRIAEIASVMLPEALSLANEIPIPRRNG